MTCSGNAWAGMLPHRRIDVTACVLTRISGPWGTRRLGLRIAGLVTASMSFCAVQMPTEPSRSASWTGRMNRMPPRSVVKVGNASRTGRAVMPNEGSE